MLRRTNKSSGRLVNQSKTISQVYYVYVYRSIQKIVPLSSNLLISLLTSLEVALLVRQLWFINSLIENWERSKVSNLGSVLPSGEHNRLTGSTHNAA